MNTNQKNANPLTEYQNVVPIPLRKGGYAYRAQVKVGGRFILRQQFASEEEAAQAAAKTKGCTLEDLRKGKGSAARTAPREEKIIYRYIRFLPECTRRPFRARVRRSGEYNINQSFATQLEAASAVAEVIGCRLEDLLLSQKIDKNELAEETLIYKNVTYHDECRARPYQGKVMRDGKYVFSKNFPTQIEAARAVAEFKGCDLEDLLRSEEKILRVKPTRSREPEPPRSLDEVIQNISDPAPKAQPQPPKRIGIKRTIRVTRRAPSGEQNILSGRDLVSPIQESGGDPGAAAYGERLFTGSKHARSA